MDSVDKLNLPHRIRIELENAKVNTVKTLLEASTEDLLKSNLSEEDILFVKIQAAKMCYLTFSSALNARDDIAFHRLSVGCTRLDKFLRGGVAVRGITEIVGESGSGKTQLCLQMALMVQYPVDSGGLEGGAVYICTEGMFPSVRLQQLTRTFHPSRNDNSLGSTTNKINFGDNIFIEHIADAESLKQCVSVRLPQLLVRKKVKLVVIDSIAGVFRADYEPNSAATRAKYLQSIGVQLHKLAENFNISIVCINQVTDILSKGSSDSKLQSVAALGLAWANLVTTRIQLFRMSQQIRTMEVIFSPQLPSERCHFGVTQAGVAAIV